MQESEEIKRDTIMIWSEETKWEIKEIWKKKIKDQ